MGFQWPWAKRDHYHPDRTLLRYDTCERCGHLILASHVSVVSVRVQSGGLGGGFLCGAGCTPNYDYIDIGVDGKPSYYLDQVRVLAPSWVPDLSSWERLSGLDE